MSNRLGRWSSNPSDDGNCSGLEANSKTEPFAGGVMKTSYTYEYPVIDPITKGTYLLRTRKPKIKDQIQFHIRMALATRQRAKRDEKVILYAAE
jgi:hypothetical protein